MAAAGYGRSARLRALRSFRRKSSPFTCSEHQSLTLLLQTGRHDSEEESIQMDWSRAMKDNLLDTLKNILRELDPLSGPPSSHYSSPPNISSVSASKTNKLSYLNLFTKLCQKMQDDRLNGDVCEIASYLGFFPEEVFCW